ncbi:MAG: molybdate ABC transporter substrate-binding protein [Azospirillaceae bacterium]|nr:molybdate ABC transporter substrate-binding protein [Azospirillaceae bacterium]
MPFARFRGSIIRPTILATLAILALPLATPRPAVAEPVVILAAATLKDALDAVTAAAASAMPVQTTAIYGSSPGLVKQLENGAPGDLFFSADTDWMNEAVKRQLVDPATRVDVLSSSLVLVGPAPQPAATPITASFPLSMMLGDGRLAMCDPMMMPAGRYGRIALQHLGLWEGVKDHVANAENIRVALTEVAHHETPLGVVFDTDARLDNRVAIVGTFPADSHPPILFPLAAVSHGHNPDTARLLAFLVSPAARSIFESYGYAVVAPATAP